MTVSADKKEEIKNLSAQSSIVNASPETEQKKS
jgi:hypothetical protein